MGKVELPFATDEEAQTRRELLINAGIIKLDGEDIIKKNGRSAVSTKNTCKKLRAQLISQGLISTDLCVVPKSKRKASSLEEGTYKPSEIKGEADYLKKRQAYWRMLQEIVIARKTLNLVLGKRQDGDPDWVF